MRQNPPSPGCCPQNNLIALGLFMALLACTSPPPQHHTPDAAQSADAARGAAPDVQPITEAPDAAPTWTKADLPKLEYKELVTGATHAEATLPMLVMIHGMGSSPDEMKPLFASFTMATRVILPQAPIAYNGAWSWFPIDKPLEEADPKMIFEMERAAAAVALLIERLKVERPTKGQPIVAGFSQGGMLSFILATHHPEVLQLAIPIGGWLPPSLLPASLERADNGKPVVWPRIVAFHGEADDVVKLAPTAQAVDELKKRGFNATLKTWPDVAHRFPTMMQVEYFNLVRETLEPAATTPKDP